MNFKEALNTIKAFAFDVDGVLSTNNILVNENGELLRMINTKDGYALHIAIKLGYPIAIITGGKSENIKTRYEAMGIKNIYLGSHTKLTQFNEFINQYNLKADDVLYMGDDIPDYEVMKKAGLATCPLDAAPEIKSISHYVSDKKSGEGCVRDIIEQVLKVQNKWMSSPETFKW